MTPTFGKWHMYDPKTGLFSGYSFSGNEELLDINTPLGYLPYKQKNFIDVLCHKVNIDTMELEEYQPPAPSDTLYNTWSWDDATKRYVSIPSLFTVKVNKTQELKDRLSELDHSNIVDNTSMYEYQANANSRTALYQKYQAAQILKEEGSTFDVDWTLADNSVVSITDIDIKRVIQAIEVRSSKLRSTYNKLRKDLELAISREDVTKILWSTYEN